MRRDFIFHPSGLLTLVFVFAHATAMLVLFLVFTPALARVLLLLVLLWSMIYFVLRDARLALASSWRSVKIEEDERVVLIDRSGGELRGRLSRASVVTPYLVVLAVRDSLPNRRCFVVLAQDSMDAVSFRQLRMTLKWGVATA